LPALFLLLPIIGIIIINLPSRRISGKLAFPAALAVSAAYMALAFTSNAPFWPDVTRFIDAYLPLGQHLTIDFMGAVILATIGFISIISLLLDRSVKNPRHLSFANLLLIVMAGMSGVVMVRDIFTMYLFLEVAALTSFILIAIQKKRDALEGSFKYLVLSTVATVFIQSAIGIVLLTVGKVDFRSVADYLALKGGAVPVQMTAAFALFVAGLSIKGGLVPFHGWLPDAYTSAPSSVSMLLAGIVTKVAGAYTIMRLVQDVFTGSRAVSLSFMALGALSIVVGAVAAFGQSDFKRMLAYSSVSQVGYIVLAAGLGTPLGLAAAMLHFFNHAVFKSLLFVNASAVEEATGTRDMDKLGGLAHRMPVTAGTSVVGFLSTAGIPPLSGFWSKLLVILALFQAGEAAFAIIALLASILTLAYFLVMQRKVFFGKLREEWADIKEAGALNTVPALVLTGVTVLFGVLFPFVLLGMQARGLL
jgi:proton-translocating NADH-quinone oxidoreductase chain N